MLVNNSQAPIDAHAGVVRAADGSGAGEPAPPTYADASADFGGTTAPYCREQAFFYTVLTQIMRRGRS